MGLEKMMTASIHPQTVSSHAIAMISVGLSHIPAAENDPLDIARQMAERGITLVSFSYLITARFLRAYKPLQFVVACEPELSSYKVSVVQITRF